MSYILDALKKAESERRLGSVPNVYAAAPDAATTPGGQRWHSVLPWLLAAMMLTIVVFVLTWFQPWRQPAPSMPAPPAVATVAPPATAEKPIPAVPPTPPEVKPEPIAPPPISPPLPQRPGKPPIPVPATAKDEITPAAPTIAVAPAKEPIAAAPSEENPVGTMHDLPQNIQAGLPAIVVNGYIYAKNPADRSVLINQKLLHEGDQITSELVLEKLLPKGAILNFKGYRYRVAF